MSQPEIIRLIAANFVPVAANLYEIRKEEGQGGDFFRQVRELASRTTPQSSKSTAFTDRSLGHRQP